METPLNVGRRSRLLLVFACLVLAGTAALVPSRIGNHVASADSVLLASGGQLYFTNTGQRTSGPFVAYWYNHKDIGDPVGPVVQVGDHWAQWFQYARLESDSTPFEQATSDNVHRAPIGQEYANQIGYSNQIDAFQPRSTPVGERFFPDTGHSISHGFKTFYETRPGIPEQMGPPISEEFSVGETVYQFFQFGALSWSAATSTDVLPLGTLDAGLNGRLGTPEPRPETSASLDPSNLLEIAAMLPGERWLEVDLSDFQITAWVGDVPVFKSIVVTGAPNSPTPTGTFSIWLKNDVQTLNGVRWDGTEYHEKDVPWVMYFYQDYAVHSSTWREEFGISDSPGCVIPPMAASEALYKFADYGTRVEVHN
jgi:hypothetical protein